MGARKTLHVTRREDWRAWLAEHHRSESEVWLVFYKKHTGRARVSYEEAVEEALCFGWIDSLVRKLDDERFAQKFTPRREGSRWSALNQRRLRKLQREGRMTAAGLAKLGPVTPGDAPRESPGGDDADLPGAVRQALMASPKAWKNFQSVSPARRRAYLRLILDAKKEETRERRLREAIALLEQGQGDPDEVPKFVKQALMASPPAWENFRNLAPSYRRHYLGWILHARQEETRERRLREAVSLLERNEKLGLK
jgi:uncharacterized protein YdeI (YjbR/CyaY-like superfamily)